jgi:hypothetical protein
MFQRGARPLPLSGQAGRCHGRAEHVFVIYFHLPALLAFSGMDSKKQPRKRITLVLRVELIDRVLEKARLLQQGPNNFVNLCVEGILNAMDEPGTGCEIPVLALYNQIKGRTFLTAKAVMTLLGALVRRLAPILPVLAEWLSPVCKESPSVTLASSEAKIV